MTTKIKFHGYVHTSGTLQVKRFFSSDDIDVTSPFVAKYLPPIMANNRDDAIRWFNLKIKE